jgi:hypothetical protein
LNENGSGAFFLFICFYATDSISDDRLRIFSSSKQQQKGRSTTKPTVCNTSSRRKKKKKKSMTGAVLFVIVTPEDRPIYEVAQSVLMIMD